MKQVIISVGREFGSGGHEIADKLSKIYNLPMYDHNLLDEIAHKMNVSGEELREYDESKKSKLFSRTVRGMSSSPEQNVADLQFDYIKKKADSGESFVVVGRCSEKVLADNKNMISIFVLGDIPVKTKRVMEIYNLSEEDAFEFCKEKDRKRKKYHNSHCEGKWGDSRNYELSINSSKLGIDRTVEIIKNYIDERIK